MTTKIRSQFSSPNIIKLIRIDDQLFWSKYYTSSVRDMGPVTISFWNLPKIIPTWWIRDAGTEKLSLETPGKKTTNLCAVNRWIVRLLKVLKSSMQMVYDHDDGWSVKKRKERERKKHRRWEQFAMQNQIDSSHTARAAYSSFGALVPFHSLPLLFAYSLATRLIWFSTDFNFLPSSSALASFFLFESFLNVSHQHQLTG